MNKEETEQLVHDTIHDDLMDLYKQEMNDHVRVSNQISNVELHLNMLKDNVEFENKYRNMMHWVFLSLFLTILFNVVFILIQHQHDTQQIIELSEKAGIECNVKTNSLFGLNYLKIER